MGKKLIAFVLVFASGCAASSAAVAPKLEKSPSLKPGYFVLSAYDSEVVTIIALGPYLDQPFGAFGYRIAFVRDALGRQYGTYIQDDGTTKVDDTIECCRPIVPLGLFTKIGGLVRPIKMNLE